MTNNPHQTQAFAQLVKVNSSKYYATAYRMLANKTEAQDIVQEAFTKLWQAPHKWNPQKQTKFSTWFYRVIINLCLDFKKKRRALPIAEGMEFPAESIDLDRIIDQQVKAKQLEALIQALPQRQQIALNLSFYEGLSNKESAEIMEINIKALESLLMRAKTQLKSQIKDNDKQSSLREA
ncbi:MAG: sigma-70 family RNA polymerase sigma factor [Cyanobacteria bacterium]|nr:sigma-70 family RNA polymerase sigma factor [Cyanobacteriota bacterium]MDA1020722.1 sigma-70 family RNA polymerase sigma factor [Cyanobacteriota bacterium]